MSVMNMRGLTMYPSQIGGRDVHVEGCPLHTAPVIDSRASPREGCLEPMRFVRPAGPCGVLLRRWRRCRCRRATWTSRCASCAASRTGCSRSRSMMRSAISTLRPPHPRCRVMHSLLFAYCKAAGSGVEQGRERYARLTLIAELRACWLQRGKDTCFISGWHLALKLLVARRSAASA